MDFPVTIPFAASMGFELLKFEGGEAEIAVNVRPDQCNNWGVAHGGLTMTLLDVTMAHAARSPQRGQPDDGRGVVTIEMKTSFLRPGPMRLRAQGRVLHRSRSMAFCEGSVVDEASGELVAHATGTFKYMGALTVGDRVVQRRSASD
jgi:uncharacterized protein (TIGR00369 family)